MSAYKTAIIRLGEEEYRRLRSAEETLRLQDLRRSDWDDHQEGSIYDNILATSRVRDTQFNDIVAELNESFAQSADEAERWLDQQSQAAEEQIALLENNAAQWLEQVSRQMEMRQAKLEEQLIRQSEIQQAQFQFIQETERIKSQAEDAAEAQRWIECGRSLLEYLPGEYFLDPKSANEIEIQRGVLNESVRLYNLEHYSIAWQAAYNAVSELSRLRHKLEGELRSRQQCHQALVNQAEEVLARISDQQGVQAMDVDGNELAERIDTSFWTDGAYAVLVEQSTQAFTAVQGLTNLDSTEMAEWQEELAILGERGLKLVTQARLAVLASQLRFNVAQIVVQALESQGFYLEEATYHQNDFRGAFIAQTRNLAGNEVVVTIDPDPGLDEGGRLSIQSNDSYKVTEHELTHRTREIFDAIQSYGVAVSSAEIIPTTPEQANTRPLIYEKKQNKSSIFGSVPE